MLSGWYTEYTHLDFLSKTLSLKLARVKINYQKCKKKSKNKQIFPSSAKRSCCTTLFPCFASSLCPKVTVTVTVTVIVTVTVTVSPCLSQSHGMFHLATTTKVLSSPLVQLLTHMQAPSVWQMHTRRTVTVTVTAYLRDNTYVVPYGTTHTWRLSEETCWLNLFMITKAVRLKE